MYILKKISSLPTRKSTDCSKCFKKCKNVLFKMLEISLCMTMFSIGLFFYFNTEVEHSCSDSRFILYVSHYLISLTLIPYLFTKNNNYSQLLTQLSLKIVLTLTLAILWTFSRYSIHKFQFVFSGYFLTYSALLYKVHKKYYTTRKKRISKISPLPPIVECQEVFSNNHLPQQGGYTNKQKKTQINITNVIGRKRSLSL